METILKEAIQEEISKKMMEISLLQQMMGGHHQIHESRISTPPKKTIRLKGTKNRVLQCIQCEPKPVNSVYIGNKLGGSELPKDDYIGRKRHFSGIAVALTALTNEQLVKRRLNGGVYEYSKI